MPRALLQRILWIQRRLKSKFLKTRGLLCMREDRLAACGTRSSWFGRSPLGDGKIKMASTKITMASTKITMASTKNTMNTRIREGRAPPFVCVIPRVLFLLLSCFVFLSCFFWELDHRVHLLLGAPLSQPSRLFFLWSSISAASFRVPCSLPFSFSGLRWGT